MGSTLAGRQVLPQVSMQGAKAPFPLPDLRVVLNLQTPGWEAGDFEGTLVMRDDGKNDVRKFIKDSVASRSTFDLPFFGPQVGPGSDPKWVALRDELVAGTLAPLRVGGAALTGPGLADLIIKGFDAAQRKEEVHTRSIIRTAVFDGFLAPLVEKLASEYKAGTPVPAAGGEYRPGFQDTHRHATEAAFREATSQITAPELVEEAWQDLQAQMDERWGLAKQAMHNIGLEVVRTKKEHMQTGYSLGFASLPIYKSREIVYYKNGQEVPSGWH
uniref:Uncharacterized protein n=1 Tax=Zooxanthella nutricula TaxID=1333877 RepID=A0A7S2N835_9DINO